MKKTVLVILLTTILIYGSYSQTIKVEYEQIHNIQSGISSTNQPYYLIISSYKSLYYNNPGENKNIFFNIDFQPEILKETDEGVLFKIDDNHTSLVLQKYYYKNYSKNELKSNERLSKKEKFVVKEPINMFDWEIRNGSDTTIFGYKCQKATTNFKGRVYEAYFCPDIANYGGPWKFDGLPGLILSVRSTDDVLVINPVKLEIVNETETVEDPFGKQKTISWQEFTTKFREHYLNIIKRMDSYGSGPRGRSTIYFYNRIEWVGFDKLSSDDVK